MVEAAAVMVEVAAVVVEVAALQNDGSRRMVAGQSALCASLVTLRVTLPKLDVLTLDQPLGGGNGRIVGKR